MNMTDTSTNIPADNDSQKEPNTGCQNGKSVRNSSKRMRSIKNVAYLILAFLISLFMPVLFTVLYLIMNEKSYMSIHSLVTASIFVSILSFCLAYYPLNKMTIRRLKVLKVVCAFLTFLWSGFCVLFMSIIAYN